MNYSDVDVSISKGERIAMDDIVQYVHPEYVHQVQTMSKNPVVGKIFPILIT